MYWKIWLLLINIGQVTLMKIRKSLNNLVKLTMQARLEIIAEREYKMSQNKLNRLDWFPKFKIIRRPEKLATSEDW